MELYFTKAFEKDYKKLPLAIQKRLDIQLIAFLQNNRHPSLRIKKMQGHTDIWEGRITRQYRFTFQIHSDRYIIRRAGVHSILNNP